jgi:acetyl-CoA acetyltransferase
MHFAAQGVIAGAYDIVVAAGVESMPGSWAGIVTGADTQTAQYADLNEWLQRRLGRSVLDVAGMTP